MMIKEVIIIEPSARKIKAVKGGKHYRWKVPFYTNGKMIHCESSVERDYVRILDFDSNIIDVIHQPLLINYKYKGKNRKYYPDFKVITQKGDIWLVEVKSQSQLNNDKNLPKYIVGKMFCDEKGWDYRIVTDREIRKGYLQYNLSLLRANGNQFVSEKVLRTVLEKLLHIRVCTLKILRLYCSELDDCEYYPAIYSLILNHRIFGDLISFKIGSEFEVSIKDKED